MRSHQPRALITEIDTWRAGRLMLMRYGERAFEESAARADELALAGDDDGAATWRRIMAAVEQLANKTPPGRVNYRSKSNAWCRCSGRSRSASGRSRCWLALL
jgi:hypothetical protein